MPRQLGLFQRNADGFVRRFDSVDLPSVIRTPEGFLRAPATRVARVGVQEYLNDDGSTQRELRLPSEVFAPISVDSLDGKPVVHEHPGYVDARNAREHSRGVVTRPRQDGDYLVADVTIHDATLIEAIERGDSELSLGYWAKLEPLANGVFRQDGHPLDGTKADFIQTRIDNNHLACTARGRANDGTTDRPVRLRLDSAGDQQPPKKKEETVKVKLPNGKEIDVSEESAAEINAYMAASASSETNGKVPDKSAEQIAAATARADAAEAKLKAVSTAGTEAARFSLLEEAKAVLKLDVAELVGRSNKELNVEILKVRRPELKLDGTESDDFIRGVMLDARTTRNTGADMARAIAVSEPKAGQMREDAVEHPFDKAMREKNERVYGKKVS